MNETIEEAASRLSITIEELLAEAAIIRYSTTLAMNRLIERKGPKLGLLITEGFEDTTLIGRASQWADGVPFKYQRNIAGVDRPEPLIDKEMIVGVRQHVDSRGRDALSVGRASPARADRGPGRPRRAGLRGLAAVVVRQAGARAPDQGTDPAGVPSAFLGAMPVFLSSEVAPRMFEYPRTKMTVLNAYLHQSMYEELSGINEELRDRGYRSRMMMIHNTGGMASVLRTSAVNTYNGGPVAGLMGSAYIGSIRLQERGGDRYGRHQLRHRHGRGGARASTVPADHRPWVVDATIVDCHSIGAGGGSIDASTS